jgi:OOP family OmpA-OmpF porin
MRSVHLWRASALLAVTALVAAPLSADAQDVSEPWYFTGDLGVAGPINDNAQTLFGLGAGSSFGVYRSVIPEVSLGGRVGFGVLSEGEPLLVAPGEVDLRRQIDVPSAPPPVVTPPVTRPVLPPVTTPPITAPIPPADQGQLVRHGVLDYEYLTLNLRVRPLARLLDDGRRGTGLYLDAGAGVGLLDGDFAPVFDGAIGWNFGLGPIAIGPKFQFTHAVELNGRFGDDDILTWMGGLEIAFFDQARVEPVVTAEADIDVEGPRADLGVEAEADMEDRDGDWIADANDRCPDEREVFNGLDDADGCPDEGTGEFVNNALIVDERVFFDYDSPELRETGTEQLDEVVSHYREHGDAYERLVIGGHTDSRGTMTYNEGLSRERADAVVDYLVAQGIPRDIIEVEAYGEMAPAIPDAATEFEHQVNRRVAFRIDWAEGQEPVGVAPEAQPTLPEIIDEAPASVQERELRADVQEREARERQLAEAELEALPEEDRMALNTEREATEREVTARAEADVEMAEAQAQLDLEAPEAELEVQEPQARVELEAPEAELEVQEPQARLDLQEGETIIVE